VLSHILKSFLRNRLAVWARKSKTSIDDFVVKSLNRTLLPFLYIVGIYTGVSYLNLTPRVEGFIELVMKILITFFIVRIIVTSISFLLASYIRKQQNGEEKLRQTRGIMLVISIIIWCFGLVFLLGNLGFNVTAVIAGLGIGGIAVALAAQT